MVKLRSGSTSKRWMGHWHRSDVADLLALIDGKRTRRDVQETEGSREGKGTTDRISIKSPFKRLEENAASSHQMPKETAHVRDNECKNTPEAESLMTALTKGSTNEGRLRGERSKRGIKKK